MAVPPGGSHPLRSRLSAMERGRPGKDEHHPRMMRQQSQGVEVGKRRACLGKRASWGGGGCRTQESSELRTGREGGHRAEGSAGVMHLEYSVGRGGPEELGERGRDLSCEVGC